MGHGTPPTELLATDWDSDPVEPGPPVGVHDVERAAAVIARHLQPTPLVRNPLLAERAGCDIRLKLENAQPVGSFKIRGALNLLESLGEAGRTDTLVTASRGNFGQSLARAAALYGTPCTVFVPEGNSPGQNDAIRAAGAQLVVRGHDFDAAWDAAVRHARACGARAVHPARHAAVLAGHGTVALEMIDQSSEPFDTVLVPVGSGALAAATAIVFSARSPGTRLIAVQAENAPAAYHAWHTGHYVPFAAADSVADGLATRVPVRGTIEVLRTHAHDFVTVPEQAIHEAIRCCLETVHQLAEGAGAAALAAALMLGERLAGQRVGVVLSGGNIDTGVLREVLERRPGLRPPQAMPMYPLASLDYGDR